MGKRGVKLSPKVTHSELLSDTDRINIGLLIAYADEDGVISAARVNENTGRDEDDIVNSAVKGVALKVFEHIDPMGFKVANVKPKPLKDQRQRFLDVYHNWCESRGVPCHIRTQDAAAVSTIIKYLTKAIEHTESNDPLPAFEYILQNWDRLTPFLKSSLMLSDISSKLPNMLHHFRNEQKRETKPIDRARHY